MNKARRDKIAEIMTALQELSSQVSTLQEEEQESFDGMPENLQSSDKGQTVEGNVSQLEEAVTNIDGAVDSLGAIE